MDIYIRMIAAAVAAGVVCCGCAASSRGASSAAESSAVQTEESTAEESTAEEFVAEPIPPEEPGELLSKAAEVFRSGTYSYRCTLTDSEGNVTEIVRDVAPNNYYQLQTNKIGTSGSVCENGEAYDFDNVCRLCAKSTETALDNIVLDVYNSRLPHTSNHINAVELQEYDIEEYTYTGETYITAFDFYFDKNSGTLKKCVTTYSVEGADDIIETREFSDISGEADESLFNLGIISTLTRFDELTQDECQELFEQLCDNAGITDSDIVNYGITRDKLGRLDYDEIVELIYTCGYKTSYETADQGQSYSNTENF